MGEPVRVEHREDFARERAAADHQHPALARGGQTLTGQRCVVGGHLNRTAVP